MILVPLSVVALFVLFDVILLSVYKFKLCNIAAMSAAYAAELPSSQDIEKRTKDIAKEMISRSQLPAKKIVVKTGFVDLDEVELIEVEVQGEFELLNGCNLPPLITLKERAVAPLPANRVHAVLGISPYPYAQDGDMTKPCVYLPIVRPSHSLPVWSFPFDTSLNYLRVVQGDEPNLPAPKPNYAFLQRPSLY
jgi:hypothetical protein